MVTLYGDPVPLNKHYHIYGIVTRHNNIVLYHVSSFYYNVWQDIGAANSYLAVHSPATSSSVCGLCLVYYEQPGWSSQHSRTIPSVHSPRCVNFNSSLMSYTFRAGDLPKLDLDVDRGLDFLAWEKQWNSYMTLSGLADSAPAMKVHALRFCLSRETLTLVDNLGLTDAQKADQVQIVASLKRYVQGGINETMERRNFRQCKQVRGETFDDYLVSLRELAKTCNFCNNNCLLSNLRDQLVGGIIDPDTVRDLLKEPNLTLEKAIDTCRAMEAAKKELHSMPGTSASALDTTVGIPVKVASLESTSGESIYTVSRYKQGTKGKRGPVSTPAELGSSSGCGRATHPAGRRTACPAFHSVCSNCGKIGHYHTVCHQKPGNLSAGRTRKLPPQTNHLLFMGPRQIDEASIHHPGIMYLNHTDPAPTLPVHIQALNGQATVEVLPDSGTDISAAGVDFLTHFNEDVLNLLPSDVKPRAFNGNILSAMGSLKVVISIGSRSVEDYLNLFDFEGNDLLSQVPADDDYGIVEGAVEDLGEYMLTQPQKPSVYINPRVTTEEIVDEDNHFCNACGVKYREDDLLDPADDDLGIVEGALEDLGEYMLTQPQKPSVYINPRATTEKIVDEDNHFCNACGVKYREDDLLDSADDDHGIVEGAVEDLGEYMLTQPQKPSVYINPRVTTEEIVDEDNHFCNACGVKYGEDDLLDPADDDHRIVEGAVEDLGEYMLTQPQKPSVYINPCVTTEEIVDEDNRFCNACGVKYREDDLLDLDDDQNEARLESYLHHFTGHHHHETAMAFLAFLETNSKGDQNVSLAQEKLKECEALKHSDETVLLDQSIENLKEEIHMYNLVSSEVKENRLWKDGEKKMEKSLTTLCRVVDEANDQLRKAEMARIREDDLLDPADDDLGIVEGALEDLGEYMLTQPQKPSVYINPRVTTEEIVDEDNRFCNACGVKYREDDLLDLDDDQNEARLESYLHHFTGHHHHETAMAFLAFLETNSKGDQNVSLAQEKLKECEALKHSDETVLLDQSIENLKEEIHMYNLVSSAVKENRLWKDGEKKMEKSLTTLCRVVDEANDQLRKAEMARIREDDLLDPADDDLGIVEGALEDLGEYMLTQPQKPSVYINPRVTTEEIVDEDNRFCNACGVKYREDDLLDLDDDQNEARLESYLHHFTGHHHHETAMAFLAFLETNSKGDQNVSLAQEKLKECEALKHSDETVLLDQSIENLKEEIHMYNLVSSAVKENRLWKDGEKKMEKSLTTLCRLVDEANDQLRKAEKARIREEQFKKRQMMLEDEEEMEKMRDSYVNEIHASGKGHKVRTEEDKFRSRTKKKRKRRK